MTLATPLRVGIVGAGMAGLACGQALAMSGARVQLVDKGRGPGGRLATRRLPWADDPNLMLGLDHGAQVLHPRDPGFAAWLAGGEAQGWSAPWTMRLGGAWAAGGQRQGWVGVPGMSALAQAMRRSLSVASGQPVVAVGRGDDGLWTLRDAAGMAFGPFDRVVVALPPAQAAPLLAPLNAAWAQALAAREMRPCWTLLAVSDEPGDPGWDVIEPETGPIAWVARNHRKPGRVVPPGVATWVVQAGAAWSQAHVGDPQDRVQDALLTALQGLLVPRLPTRWHHVALHRWLYALAPAGGRTGADGQDCWWDAAAGLGVCGDHFVGADVESAWRSGRALARAIALEPAA
jgi:renalase